ncbi:sporulation inhibitor of replication protein SirA [Bacillus sp. CGMCC 1.16607]|uniref:sporulation inhibitor of replication protein SirA n=1 Tax=Bacillus sp. CGMCC 1.16607 TaxID=3351842 RepID=UPI003630A5A5
MRVYQLYLIEDEFANHYFGRERMFFELFLESEQSSGKLKLIINKQINYITKPIPALRIHQMIHQELSKVKGYSAKNGFYEVALPGKTSGATLVISDKYVTVTADGSYEAEAIFFEVLRKCEPSFLAIDTECGRYGWLKPIKERKFV